MQTTPIYLVSPTAEEDHELRTMESHSTVQKYLFSTCFTQSLGNTAEWY